MDTNTLKAIAQPVIEALQTGHVPWHHTPKPYWGFARNYASDTEYTGIDWVLLNLVHRRQSPWFLTKEQIQDLGGEIKKDYTPVLGCSVQSGTLRLQYLFNSKSVDGIEFEPPVYPPDELNGEYWPCNDLFHHMNKLSGYQIFRAGQDRASGGGLGDMIDPPFRDWYDDDYDGGTFMSLYTKAIHWTGHEQRLARAAIVQKFNPASFAFSQEHLVGEIGTAYLCMSVGVDRRPFVQPAPEYCETWIKRLQDDPGILWRAAEQANEAVQYLLPRP